MKFQTYQMGDDLPKAFQNALHLINANQTIWKLSSPIKITKPNSSAPNKNLSFIPSDKDAFCIGITIGSVDQKNNLSVIKLENRKALISDDEWCGQKNKSYSYDPSEVFWALGLANICFQASISKGCATENCLGYKNLTIDKLLLRLLELHICNECKQKIYDKYKYRYNEIVNLVDKLKNPNQYGSSVNFDYPYLPVFSSQVRCQKKKKAKPFKNVGIITVMHFLENFVLFIEALLELGAKKESIVVLVKPYPYSHRAKVHSYIFQKYPEIRIEYLDSLPPNNTLMTELVEHCRKKSVSGKILVIEDGGYIVSFLHKKFRKGQNFCIGAVEQTTKGLRKDEKIKKYRFPILDVAKSKFKDEYESPLVGRSIADSIRKLLNEYHLPGKTALVVGFGAVGREVAYALANMGMIIKIADKDLKQIVAAKVRGFEASKTAADFAQDATIIVGTTGYQSISSEILDKLKNGAILVSASSDRIEIDINHLDTFDDNPKYTPELGTWYSRKKSSNTEDKYLLLADGYPINFYSGAGIPTTSIDPVLAQLLIGAIHLVKNSKNLKPGIHKEITDKLNEKFRLIDDFLAETK